MEGQPAQGAMNEYEIRVRGQLSRALTRQFERQHLAVRYQRIDTILEGRFEDQSALYGMLRQLECLGLELVDLHCVRTSGS